MKPNQIIHYRLKWNPKSKIGAIEFHMGNNSTVRPPVDSVEEFTAVTLLQKSPLFILQDGSISTEWEDNADIV